MAQGSKKAVLYAIAGNTTVTILKFIAATLTHSAAMMNEAVHSLMDTLNQIFLLIGLRSGSQPADREYAFGHGQKKYLWNLWSAIGLFSIGCGLGLAHAWHAWKQLGQVEVPTVITVFNLNVPAFWVSAIVLVIALLLEGYVLLVAYKEFLSRMRAKGISSRIKYFAKADDPTLIAILLEDTVAVSGVIFAAAGIGLTQLSGNHLWDIGFSVVIALMLGVTAIFLGKINMRYLTNVRDLEAEQVFCEILKNYREVERFHDLRSIVVDDTHTVIVAEIELREEVIMGQLRESIAVHRHQLMARVPLEKQTAAMRDYVETRSVIQATLEHTEKVIDKLEAELKARCPQVFHLTVEVEGLVEPLNLDELDTPRAS